MFNHRRWLPVSLLVLTFAAWSAYGQSDSSQISGYVKDSSGAVIPGATVTVKNETRDFRRDAVTNDAGYYVVANVPPGLYTVSVELSGFKRFETTHKKVDPAIPTTVDATLEVGEISQTVSVTASTTNVQTETATLGKLVDASQIQYMQLNGRNPIFLALLKPGVSSNTTLGGFNFGLTTGGLNINGSRTQDNLITFDGAVAVRTRSNGTSIGAADVDAVQEVQILTADYNPEYGRSAGGQIRIVTKSGTRDFHGTMYEFMRNSAFDANTWARNKLNPFKDKPCEQFSKENHCRPEPLRYNQFGYNASGPILLPFTNYNSDRNKLFWLWGQEWVRQRRASTTITTVPSLKMRQGDFSELLNPANQFFNRAIVIRDPNTNQPLPGNIIPANLLSPNGLALLRAYPEPTPNYNSGTSANFFQERPTTTDQRKDTVSIDFYPSEKHQFRFRRQMYHFVDTSAFRGNTDRAPQIITRPNQTTSLNWVWTMSPTWVNEMLLTGSRDQVFIAVDTRGDRYKRSIYGINYRYIFPDRKEITDKIPTVNFPQVITDLDGGPYPSSSTGPIYDASNNVTKIMGNHTIKFGGLFERSGQNDFDQINVSGVPGGTNNQNGRFEFRDLRPGSTTSGLALSNAAMGLFSSYAEIGVRSFTPYRGHMFEWFAQDSWKVRPNLRVEFGVRHSIIQPYYSLWRNMVVFDSKFYDPSIAVTLDRTSGFITSGDLKARYNGLVFPGSGWPDAAKGRIPIATSGEYNFMFRGVPKQYSQIHKTLFQPRLGFAYSINPKMVVRAGVGRFVTRVGVSDSVFLGGNPPLQPMVSISNGLADDPGGGSNRAFTQNITTQDPIFKNPEAWAWNVTVEREVGYGTTVEVGYVGRRGLHGQRERNINQLQPGTLFRPENIGANADFLRPYKGFNTIRVTNNDANSMYNGLQVGVTRRFTGGFSYSLGYTYSKLTDDGSAQRDIIPNAFDASNLWGPADYDRRHVMAVGLHYELPFYRDPSTLAGKLLGGWRITAVSQFQTGTPGSVATGDDFAGVGPGSGSQLWVVNGDYKIDHSDRKFSEGVSDQNFYFKVKTPDGKDIFTRPQGTFNTQEVRNIIYNPGIQNHNVGLFKEFFITEGQKVQFRAEAFNWINHPNWAGVNRTPTSSTFGKVTSKNDQRNLQFSLRYQF
ncbi:MAG TPA: carboxypeptidase regulatory-like domain-containing protein [Acidobacteriota bacterium]|jgi:hypothetical protein